MILQYAVIASLIQFTLHLMQIHGFAIGKSPPHTHHNRAPSMLYSWCDTEAAALSPTLHCTETLLFDAKILNFDLSIQRTLFYSSTVQSLCAFAHRSLLTLFGFLKSGFLTAILPYRSASQSLLLTMDADIFLLILVQLCSDVWSSQPFGMQADD